MKLLCTFVVSLFAAVNAFAAGPSVDGFEVGTGSDNVEIDYQSAWFLVPNQVRYCLSIDPKFSKYEKDIPELVANALVDWRTVIEANVNTDHSSLQALNLSTQFQQVTQCDDSTDLTFYFGGDHKRVMTQRVKFRNPTAFAYRESYDLHTLRGKGFIWIAANGDVGTSFPNWDLEMSLYGVILHELGHVFGCDHFEGTIMTAHLHDWMVATPDRLARRKDFLSKIGLENRVTFSSSKFVKLDGRISSDPTEAAKVFQDFFGRAARGAVKVNFSALFSLNGSIFERRLEISDDQDKKMVRVSVVNVTPVNHNSTIFKRVGFTDFYDEIPVIFSAMDFSRVEQGFVQNFAGEDRPVTLYINSKKNARSVVLEYYAPGLSKPGTMATLFESDAE